MTPTIKYSQFYRCDISVLTDLINPNVIPFNTIYIHRGYVINNVKKMDDVIIAATNPNSEWGLNVIIYVWDRRQWIIEHVHGNEQAMLKYEVEKYLRTHKNVLIS